MTTKYHPSFTPIRDEEAQAPTETSKQIEPIEPVSAVKPEQAALDELGQKMSLEQFLSQPLAALHGLTFGMDRRALAGLDALGDLGGKRSIGDRYDQAFKEWGDVTKKASANAPGSRFLGQMAPVLMGGAAAGAATKGAPWLAQAIMAEHAGKLGLAANAGVGAAQAAGESDYPLFSKETALEAAKGAGLAGLFGGAVNLTGKGLEAAGPYVKDALNSVTLRGVAPRLPEIKRVIASTVEEPGERMANVGQFLRDTGAVGFGSTRDSAAKRINDVRASLAQQVGGSSKELEALRPPGLPGADYYHDVSRQLMDAAKEAGRPTSMYAQADAAALRGNAANVADKLRPGSPPGLASMPGTRGSKIVPNRLHSLLDLTEEASSDDEAVAKMALAVLQGKEAAPVVTGATAKRGFSKAMRDAETDKLVNATGRQDLKDALVSGRKDLSMAIPLDEVLQSSWLKDQALRKISLSDYLTSGSGFTSGATAGALGGGGWAGAMLGGLISGGGSLLANQAIKKFGPGVGASALNQLNKVPMSRMGQSIGSVAGRMGASANPLVDMFKDRQNAKDHFLKGPDRKANE